MPVPVRVPEFDDVLVPVGVLVGVWVGVPVRVPEVDGVRVCVGVCVPVLVLVPVVEGVRVLVDV